MTSQNLTKTNVSGRQASTACALTNLQFFYRQAVRDAPTLGKLSFAASQKFGDVGALLTVAALAHEINIMPADERQLIGSKRHFAAIPTKVVFAR